MEIYKKLNGFDDYEISNYGNILSLKFNKIKKLKYHINTNGYYCVNLSMNGKYKKYKVHQLLAITFLDHTPCGMDMVIDHIDQNKLNNKLDNLRIVTQRENMLNISRDNYTSKYNNIYFNKGKNRWMVVYYRNNKKITVGQYKTEEEAYIQKLNYEYK